MILSILRVLLIAALLFVSLCVALGVGLALAEMGQLGSCEDGECELVAVIYVMPFLGIVLYAAALIAYSLYCRRKAVHDAR